MNTTSFKPVNQYKPGQSVHLTVVSTQLGVYTDPPQLACTVHSPSGTSYPLAVVRDAQGVYHTDFLIPMNEYAGTLPWTARWQATGSQANQNALVEPVFLVTPLNF